MFLSLIIISIFFSFFTIANTSPLCKISTNFCNYCNILTNLCVRCEFPDILVPDKNGGCTGAVRCILGKNNCYECDINGKLCKTCEDNYYPDENGGCSYTEGCEFSYMGECLKCKNGYILIGRDRELKICKSLSLDYYKNCQNINSETGYCNMCKDGYFLTRKDYKCIKAENCEESIFGNCVACSPGYYLNRKEDKCELKKANFTYCKESNDGKICELCEDGCYFDENGICIQTQFCSKSNNYICIECKPDYYLLKDSVYNICTNTDNCNSADRITSICTFCKTGYYLDLKDFKCKPNEEDGPFKYCRTVENDLCRSCDYNYYLGEDFKCSESLYCSESENGQCLFCQKNFNLGLDNICTNVEKCIYSHSNSCNECIDGYYYDKLAKKCLEMKEGLLNCKFTCDYNSNTCCECKNDFYLFENDSLCYDNSEEEPFIKCAIVDSNKEYCKNCIDGYFLGTEDNKCSKDENCKISLNEKTCLECDTYYCLDVKNQICFDNDFLSEFNDKIHISCNRTNEEGTACAECINGYELNEEGLCVDIDICEEKKGGKCNKCKNIISPNGYHYCANEIFGCLETAVENCLRCDNLNNLYQCTQCEEGYYYTYNTCWKLPEN